MVHETVMLEETVAGLNVREGGTYVDGTLGGGGHSELILQKLGGTGQLIGIDQDDFALEKAKERLKGYDNMLFVKGNFQYLEEILDDLGIDRIDGVLLDLGVSSFQFDDGDRGFSYRQDALLDMRMNQEDPLTAAMIVNDYSLDDLTTIFRDYGEEKYAYSIAKNIVRHRDEKPIETTFQLVDIIKKALPDREKRKKGHPGKKVFQSLRIAVNGELDVLAKALDGIEKRLKDKGRMSIITFHSLEDRIVKQFIKAKENPCTCPKSFPHCICGKVPTMKNLTRKPIEASEAELIRNNRARSAKLRIGEKIGG